MMLSELLRQVHTQRGISDRRIKDLQTSIRYLARALGYASPDHCPDDAFLTPDWKARVTEHFGTLPTPVSPYTVRNTRQNLLQLFRAAQALDLISPSAALSSPTMSRVEVSLDLARSSPYNRRQNRSPYSLAHTAWPSVIRCRWSSYCRERSLKLRTISLNSYQRRLEIYLGFLTNVQGTHISSWEDLFHVVHLDHYIRWQAQRCGVRMPQQARLVTDTLLHLARYTHQPTTAALEQYARGLPPPDPFHNKQSHWFTLQELEQVGLALLRQAHMPVTSHRAMSGVTRTLKHQMALVLRLLVRVPLRQRNIRGMQLGRNLCHDRGQWHLSFTGEELKIGHRRGKPNMFHVNLHEHCPDLIPHLEEYLQTFRPRHKHADVSPYVFLTQRGRAYAAQVLRAELRAHVYRYTQRLFYPHLIRTIWATEFINKTGDFTTAAYMLNDNVKTVLQQYQEILEKDHAQKASEFLKRTFAYPG